MATHISAREARARFAELTDRVRYTGESVIVEKQGRPFVAVVSLEDFALLDRLRESKREFSRLAAQAAAEVSGAEPSEDEIVAAVNRTREELYRERYGTA